MGVLFGSASPGHVTLPLKYSTQYIIQALIRKFIWKQIVIACKCLLETPGIGKQCLKQLFETQSIILNDLGGGGDKNHQWVIWKRGHERELSGYLGPPKVYTIISRGGGKCLFLGHTSSPIIIIFLSISLNNSHRDWVQWTYMGTFSKHTYARPFLPTHPPHHSDRRAVVAA